MIIDIKKECKEGLQQASKRILLFVVYFENYPYSFLCWTRYWLLAIYQTAWKPL